GPLLAVVRAAPAGVIPALHAHGRGQLAADAQPAAGDELQEDLLVGGAAQPPIGERDGVLAGAALGAPPLRHPAARRGLGPRTLGDGRTVGPARLPDGRSADRA